MNSAKAFTGEKRSHGVLERLNILASAATAVSIRAKIMGIWLGFALALGFGMTIEIHQILSVTLGDALEKRTISIARDLSARSSDLILTNNMFALYELARDTLENNEDARYVFILDANGNVLIHTFGNNFPAGLASANFVVPGDRFRLEVLDTEEGLIRDVAVPIFEGRAGTARVGLSSWHLQQTIDTTIRQMLTITALVSTLGLAAAYALTLLLTRPVLELVEVARAVGSGNLQKKARVWSRDDIGQLAEAVNAMIDDLARSKEEIDRKEDLRVKLLQKVISVQEEERKRIARELHDETSQSLTSLIVGLKILENAQDMDEVRKRAGEIRIQTTHALETVHDLALELRPSVLDDLGLDAALQRYAKEFALKHDVEVDFQVIGAKESRLGPEVETAVYRIVQEALTNIARHARAKNVSVLLEYRREILIAIVEDNGTGFDVSDVLDPKIREKKLGLFGMQERASLIGAKLTIESQRGTGTTVFVEIPIYKNVTFSQLGDIGR